MNSTSSGQKPSAGEDEYRNRGDPSYREEVDGRRTSDSKTMENTRLDDINDKNVSDIHENEPQAELRLSVKNTVCEYVCVCVQAVVKSIYSVISYRRLTVASIYNMYVRVVYRRAGKRRLVERCGGRRRVVYKRFPRTHTLTRMHTVVDNVCGETLCTRRRAYTRVYIYIIMYK